MSVEVKTEKDSYSAAELEEFRQIITKKIEENKSEIKRISLDIRDNQDDLSLDDQVVPYIHTTENLRILRRLEGYVNQLGYALLRIENRTYGKCCITGTLIPKERLMATPTTTKCIEVKNQKN